MISMVIISRVKLGKDDNTHTLTLVPYSLCLHYSKLCKLP